MNSQEILGDTLQWLQYQIKGLRKELKQEQLTPNQMAVRLQVLVEGLTDSTRSLSDLAKLDQEVESKRKIYQHLAEFLQDHFYSSASVNHFNNFNICLNAAYLLCQEQDSRIVYSRVYSQQAHQLERMAKEHNLVVEVKYERFQEQKIYRRQLNIAAHKTNNKLNEKTNNHSSSTIQTETVERRSIVDTLAWQELPPAVQNAFVKSRKNHFSFRIYPVHTCSQTWNCCCPHASGQVWSCCCHVTH